MLSLIFLVSLWGQVFGQGHGFFNRTIDDTNPAIRYSGSWGVEPFPLSWNHSHRVSQELGAIATFSFTGTAIYFLSPLWPYHIASNINLDGNNTLVDLMNPSSLFDGENNEIIPSEVVWAATDLPNTQHTLVVSSGWTLENGHGYAVVDGFIVTGFGSESSDPSPIIHSSTMPSPSPTPSPSLATASEAGPQSSAPPSTTSNSSSKHGAALNIILPIACTLGGVLLTLICVFIIWQMKRRHRYVGVSRTWTIDNTPPTTPVETMEVARPSPYFRQLPSVTKQFTSQNS